MFWAEPLSTGGVGVAPFVTPAAAVAGVASPTVCSFRLVCAKSWLTRAESISCAAFCFAASGAEDAEAEEPPMLGAVAPAFRIGRPRSPGSGGPSCGAWRGWPV